MRPLQICEPVLNQATRDIEIQLLVFAWIFFEVCQGQFEQRGGGARMISLQMHERAGELNQALVKRAIRAVFIFQPDVFKHFVCLVKKLAVETVKKTGVMLVEFVSPVLFHQRGDAFMFVAHEFKVKAK